MTLVETIYRFFYPVFYGPFEVPGFPSWQSLHRVVIHFPIVLFALTWLADLLAIVKRDKTYTQHSETLFRLGFVALIFAYITGQITSNRRGLSIRDPQWLMQNQELGSSVVNHRGLATLTVITFTLILVTRLILSKRAQIQPNLKPWITFGLMTAGFLILTFTAHFGANLKL